MTEQSSPSSRERRSWRGPLPSLLRLEARLTLPTKLLAVVGLVGMVSVLVAWGRGWERAAFERILLRTALEFVVFWALTLLLRRRTARVTDLARDVEAASSHDPRPWRLNRARDEFLVAEREIRAMARDLTLGSRQQSIMARLTHLLRVDGDVQEMMDFTVGQVSDDLGVRHVAIVQWDTDLRRLVTRSATGEGAADRVIESLLARPGLIDEALLATGPAQLLPRGGSGAAFVPMAYDGVESLLVALSDGADPIFRQEDLDYLGGVSRALLICIRNSVDRMRLQHTEDEFRSMIDRVPGILYSRTADFPPRTIYVSDQVEAMLGTPAAAWVEDESLWVDRMHPLDRDSAIAVISEAHQALGPYEVEYRLSDAEGRWRWFHDTAVVVEVEGQGPLYQGIAVDVTHEKEVEAELQVEQALLRAMVEASPVVILSVGPDGVTQFVSSAVYATTGRPVEDLVGQPATLHAHPEDVEEFQQGIDGVLGGRLARYRGTHRLLHADGHWLTLEARGEPLRDGDDVIGVAFALTDVSETVGLSIQLRAAKEAAERANVAKSEFLSRMSHELRTPMNAVLGFAQLLELEDLEVDGQESVDQILRAGGHLLSLIDEVLDISRIEAGRLNVTLEPVSLREMVGEVIDLLRPAAERQQVDVQVRGDLDGVVVADPQRFKQVVLNVVGNAIKYNNRGGQVVIASAPVQAGGPVFRLTVQDTGRGIADDLLDRVFVPFDRLGVEESGIEGTGLGLALSHRLIEVMGGVLGVESTVGSGSTFWVDLPRSTDEPIRRVLGDPVRLRGPEQPLVGRVLYVEDNLSNLRLVERLLGRHPGIDLLSAMQGTIGVQLAHDHAPDVVLLDLNLPDIDGDIVLERLKADDRTRDIPVVVISADATARQVERLQALGAHAYLTKPIDVPQLLATLGELLEARVREGEPS